MYIFITEDGVPYKGEIVTAHDKQACDDGVLEVIDIATITTYYNGGWMVIPDWDEGK